MSDRKGITSPLDTQDAIRLVPARAGKRLCTPWRLFVRGDEIYVADEGNLKMDIKVSMHSSGLLKMDMKHHRFAFTQGVMHIDAPAWRHVLQVQFVVELAEGVAEKLHLKSRTVLKMLPVPASCKLVVDIWLTRAKEWRTAARPSQMTGAWLWQRPLRTAGAVRAFAFPAPLTGGDIVELTKVRDELKINMDTEKKGPISAELMTLNRLDTGHNVVHVIPASEAQFVWRPGD